PLRDERPEGRNGLLRRERPGEGHLHRVLTSPPPLSLSRRERSAPGRNGCLPRMSVLARGRKGSRGRYVGSVTWARPRCSLSPVRGWMTTAGAHPPPAASWSTDPPTTDHTTGRTTE